MHYLVAFDLGGALYPPPTVPLILMLLLAAVLAAFAVRLTIVGEVAGSARRLRFPAVVSAIVLSGFALSTYNLQANREKLVEALKAGKVQVAEGVVENFHPMPASGHDTERFTVAGQRFAYSDYEETGGFNNTSSHGGAIKAGLPVRITYVQSSYGNVIVKLEIGRT